VPRPPKNLPTGTANRPSTPGRVKSPAESQGSGLFVLKMGPPRVDRARRRPAMPAQVFERTLVSGPSASDRRQVIAFSRVQQSNAEERARPG
jgi:hypothetical protein